MIRCCAEQDNKGIFLIEWWHRKSGQVCPLFCTGNEGEIMTYIYRVHYKNREVAISLVKPEVSDQIEQVEELEMLLPTDYTVGENWKNEKMIFDEKGNGCKLSATNSKHLTLPTAKAGGFLVRRSQLASRTYTISPSV